MMADVYRLISQEPAESLQSIFGFITLGFADGNPSSPPRPRVDALTWTPQQLHQRLWILMKHPSTQFNLQNWQYLNGLAGYNRKWRPNLTIKSNFGTIWIKPYIDTSLTDGTAAWHRLLLILQKYYPTPDSWGCLLWMTLIIVQGFCWPTWWSLASTHLIYIHMWPTHTNKYKLIECLN